MKKTLTLVFIVATSYLAAAQINAITETGDEVVLNYNGTWSYKNDSVSETTELPLNETVFEKSKSSTFLVKSTKFNIGVYLNSKSWKFEKSAEGEAAEFDFTKLGEDLYGLLITEKIEIPIESLRQIAFDNAQLVAPDVQVVHEEYRMVNGVKVLVIQLLGTIQGIKFCYYGYYYSNANGTMQFITYTSANLFQSYMPEILELLNGFVVLD